jgi:methylated-DNA-protein-cysteine methyltransferase related protein
MAKRPGSDPRAQASRSTRQGLSAFDRAVLDLVDTIPPGRVMSYGGIAECLGQGSPRLAARVMSTRCAPDTPWHRVLRADGTCAPEVAAEQLQRLRAEQTPFIIRKDGISTDRVDWKRAEHTPHVNDEP